MKDRSLLHAQHAYDNAEPDEGPVLVVQPTDLRCDALADLLSDRGIVRLSVTMTRGYYSASAETRGADGDGYDRDLGAAIAQAVSEAVARQEAA